MTFSLKGVIEIAKILRLMVNGVGYQVSIESHVTLLEILRDQLGLMGTKEGCDGGECGACTVLLYGQPVLSCLILAEDVEGKPITTIEGVAKPNQLDPVQEALLQEGAVQCGFCTPGIVLSVKALLNRNPHPAIGEIKEALSGNLCRCTGYFKIIKAVQRAVEMKKGL